MTSDTLIESWPEVAQPGAGGALASPPVPKPAGEGVSVVDDSDADLVRVVHPGAPRTLLAVDGNSIAHRAFHAYEKSGMTDPDGRPLFAVYGFLALLIGIVDKVGPDAVVVGFDDRTGSARRDRYEPYKAGRAERSDDLYAQLDQLPALLAELGITTVTPPGLEADDVLASAAAAAEAAGWRCVVATSDKDSFGLITDSTTVLRLTNGLDNAVTMDPAALHEQYGVTPAQWPDYTVLVGDKSDNLPGVRGIGEKKAAALLDACGTLDAALANPADAVAAIGKGYAGKLTADGAAETIARNRDIMAPVRTVPVDLASCRPYVTGGTVARVLRARHLPSLIGRTATVLCREAPEPSSAPSPPADQTAAPWSRFCRAPKCGAEIRMADVDTGTTMPVNPAPAPDGNLVWRRSPGGKHWLHVLAKGEEAQPGENRYVAHFATCPAADQFRSPRQATPAPAARPNLQVIPGGRAQAIAAAPSLADIGAEQPAADRTCGSCREIVPATLPALGTGRQVLLERKDGLYSWLAVLATDGWTVRPVDAGEQGLPFWNRFAEHQCHPAERCCATPGHQDRPARLRAGGWLCDACASRVR